MRVARRVVVELALVVAVAALFAFVPGSTHAGRALEAALSAAFAFAVVWTFARFYKARRFTLMLLGERNRALLYGAFASFVALLAAAPRLWQNAPGEFGFWVGIGLVVYVLFALYRRVRRY